MLQKGNENIKHFTYPLINTLTISYCSQSLVLRFQKRLLDKKIDFIRHTKLFKTNTKANAIQTTTSKNNLKNH